MPQGFKRQDWKPFIILVPFAFITSGMLGMLGYVHSHPDEELEFSANWLSPITMFVAQPVVVYTVIVFWRRKDWRDTRPRHKPVWTQDELVVYFGRKKKKELARQKRKEKELVHKR